MAEHTPGPWTVRPSLDGSGDVGITAGGLSNVLAECFYAMRKAGERAHGEAEANARLIAAAPDMLAALRCVVAAMDDNHTSALSRVDACAVEADALRDLIAQAEGR